jgi:hypothetical protein
MYLCTTLICSLAVSSLYGKTNNKFNGLHVNAFVNDVDKLSGGVGVVTAVHDSAGNYTVLGCHPPCPTPAMPKIQLYVIVPSDCDIRV